MIVFILCAAAAYVLGKLVNVLNAYFAAKPIQESKEGPHFYIVKELYKEDV